jgi:hypothetical protein
MQKQKFDQVFPFEIEMAVIQFEKETMWWLKCRENFSKNYLKVQIT